MMLIINKSNPTTKLIVTISEVNPITTGSTLELFNQYSNVLTVYNLPNDTSIYPDRYNEFILDTTTFSGLTVGSYIYTIKDSNDSITETGLLKIVDVLETQEQKVDDNYLYINEPSTNDDFIVYQQS